MSYIDDLLAAYARFLVLPWQQNIAPPQRIWIAVYPPEHERRLRLHIPDFAVATKQAQHPWSLIDITTKFEQWMATEDYREDYFRRPELLETALSAYFLSVAGDVRQHLAQHNDPDGVVALLGAGTMFGLGPSLKVSALLNAVNEAIAGRLLVFFPGQHEGNNYRLLDARDGWNYLAIPITPNGSGR